MLYYTLILFPATVKNRRTLTQSTTEKSFMRTTTPSISLSTTKIPTTYATIRGWYDGETCYPSKTNEPCSRKCGGCGRKTVVYKCYVDGFYRRE